MSVSLEFLQHSAGQTGYLPATLEKVVRLGEIAAEIARHPLLGQVLALKGGTALNLCVGEAPTRLSVDLDYNYIGHVGREEMLAARPVVEQAVERILAALGFRISRSRDDFASRTLFARYRSALGPYDRVEVDLNFLFRLPLDGLAFGEMWQPDGLDRPRIQLVSRVELFVGKLIALLARGAPRDAWDAVRLPRLDRELLLSARLRALLVGMSVILDHPIHSYGRERMARQLTSTSVQRQLLPMIVGGSAPDLGDLVQGAWSVVAPFVSLSTAEAEFVDAVHRGELRPELLAPDVAAVLAAHPAVLWKLHNVRNRGSTRT